VSVSVSEWVSVSVSMLVHVHELHVGVDGNWQPTL
jgi:hypothetical protein